MAEFFVKQRISDPRFHSRVVDPFDASTPWYTTRAPRLASLEVGIRKRHNFAKRKRYYSSDSSASEKETEGHTEGVIHRMPKGSSKEFYVYYAGKKITFGGVNTQS